VCGSRCRTNKQSSLYIVLCSTVPVYWPVSSLQVLGGVCHGRPEWEIQLWLPFAVFVLQTTVREALVVSATLR
jgi:hypothetical protein